MTQSPRSYAAAAGGYRFRLDPTNVALVKSLPDFEGREEPAVAEEFLRSVAEKWSESLAAAGASPGDVDVLLDTHQRRANLTRDGRIVFSAEI